MIIKKLNFNKIKQISNIIIPSINIFKSTKSFSSTKIFNPIFDLTKFRYNFSSISKVNFSTSEKSSEISNTKEILDIIESQRSQIEKTNYSKESLIKYFNTIADCQFYFKNYVALKNTVENHFLQTLDKTIKKDFITEESANIIIPQIIKAIFALEIYENTVTWNNLEKLINDNSDNLSNCLLIKLFISFIYSSKSDQIYHRKFNTISKRTITENESKFFRVIKSFRKGRLFKSGP